jgi:hypothetical protein
MHFQPDSETQDHIESFIHKVSPRHAPFRNFPAAAMLTATCRDCGTSHSYAAGQLVRQKLGAETVETLEKTWVCYRVTCQGPLDIDLDLGE